MASLVGGGVAVATVGGADRGDRPSAAAGGKRLVTGSVGYTGRRLDLDDDGTNETIGGVGRCPRGTQLTGGGFADNTGGELFLSAPDGRGIEGWGAATYVGPDSGARPTDLVFFMTCLGTKRELRGTYRAAPRPSGPVPAQVQATMARRLDR